MTSLRQQMTDAMVLRGFAARTQEAYLACVVALARHYRRPPDALTTDELQAYLLHLITERKQAYASVNQAACAFRFIYERVLQRPNARLDIPMAKVPKRLPQILARAEVARLIGAARSLRSRTLLMTTYAAGLRVSEVCALQVDGHRERRGSDVPQGAPGQRQPGSLHAALAASARHPAPLLAEQPSAPVAVSQSRRHGTDRRHHRTTHLRRRA